MVQLHVFFFPLMAHGHMLPTLDMANLFTSRGVKVTVITTPLNAQMFNTAIQKSRDMGFDISICEIKFPQVGLPEGVENIDQISTDPVMVSKFIRASAQFQEPIEQLLQEIRPQCFVADMGFPWATEAAAKFGIPRLIFHGFSSFALTASESVRRNQPFKNASSDSEPFIIPDLPHQIKLTRDELSPFEKGDIQSDFNDFQKKIWESEEKCYGIVVNSFYELEPDYAEYYKNFLGRKVWHLGPFLLCNKSSEAKERAQRGKNSAIDSHECLKWLDTKKPNSVIYVCFGSVSNFTAAQLKEIAMGLEASGKQFIWVVRKCVDEEDSEMWFPEGFEERMKMYGEKGLIIKGWAPQLMILEHEAVGCFVTHCGWNSTLEGVSAGVPMVTWPLFAEQFCNDKLVTQVLKMGVQVGSRKWSRVTSEVIEKEAITEAVNRVMEGEEAVEMRKRAKELKEMARKAVDEGGSSYNDLSALLEELSAYHQTTRKQE